MENNAKRFRQTSNSPKVGPADYDTLNYTPPPCLCPEEPQFFKSPLGFSRQYDPYERFP